MSDYNLLIDIEGRRLVADYFSTEASTPPAIIYGDQPTVSVRLVEPNDNNSEWPWSEVDLTGQSIRIGIGNLADATPSAYIELTDDVATPTASVTVIREGVLNVTSEIQSIKLLNSPIRGSYTITIAGEETTPLDIDSDLDVITDAVEALASISVGDIITTGSTHDFTLEFDKALGDVGTATVNVDNLRGIDKGKTGVINLHTTELLALLDDETSVEATMEVVRWTTADVAGETVLQVPVTITQDVIPDTVPSTTPLPTYATINLDQINQSGATDGQIPAWNNTTGEWEPITASGLGDMLAATYDPNTVSSDAFDMDNMVEGTNKILTTAERASIASASQPGHTHVISDITNNTAVSTGLLTGGVLSTGAGATEYSITDGTGVIATAAGAVTSVSWTGKTNITPTNIASALLTWVSIDNAGNVVERTTPISASQARSEIFLGVIVHTDLATVQVVNNEQVVSYQTGNTVHDLADAIGFVNINGNVFTANGANLSLDKSAGVMFKLGGNYDQDSTNPHNRTIAANTLAQFQYRYNDGTSGPLTDTLIDPDNLDDGAGGLTSVTNNRWSVQRIYIFLSGNIKLQRGVEDFPTKSAAIEGIASEAYVTENSIAQNGLLRGWLVIKKNASDLSDDNVAQFIAAPKFGEGSAGGASTPPGDSSAILLPALKAAAGTINIGEVVRSTGYSGGQILVELADADAAGEMPAMGVARSSFTEASAGTVIFSGVLAGLDTSSFAVNDSLYVSTTPGVLTNTRPTGAATGVQAIARVLSQDASNGVIQVIGAGRSNDLPNLTADTLWYGNGSAVPTETSITAAGRAILDDASASAQRDTLSLGTTDNPQFATIELGAATDTTLSRSAAGVLAVEGNDVITTVGTGQQEVIGIACSDETTDLTASTSVALTTFTMPFAMTLTEVMASVVTAPTDATLIVDIHDGATTIMDTNKLDILTTAVVDDNTATLSDTALAKDAIISVYADQVGSTVAGAGLKIWLIGTRT